MYAGCTEVASTVTSILLVFASHLGAPPVKRAVAKKFSVPGHPLQESVSVGVCQHLLCVWCTNRCMFSVI